MSAIRSRRALFAVVAVIGVIAALLAAPAVLEYRGADAATVAAVKASKFYLMGAALLFGSAAYWLGSPEKRRLIAEQFQQPPVLPRRTITILAVSMMVPILAARAAIPFAVEDARTRKLLYDLLAPGGVLAIGICVAVLQHRAAVKRGRADNVS